MDTFIILFAVFMAVFVGLILASTVSCIEDF